MNPVQMWNQPILTVNSLFWYGMPQCFWWFLINMVETSVDVWCHWFQPTLSASFRGWCESDGTWKWLGPMEKEIFLLKNQSIIIGGCIHKLWECNVKWCEQVPHLWPGNHLFFGGDGGSQLSHKKKSLLLSILLGWLIGILIIYNGLLWSL